MKAVLILLTLILPNGKLCDYVKSNVHESLESSSSNQVNQLINPKPDMYYQPTPSAPDGDELFDGNGDFLNNYYKRLSNNKPANYFGICGYTGISMLLTFYDSYWNDGIIEEKYDAPVTFNGTTIPVNIAQSPGVQNETMPSQNSIISKILPEGMTIEEFRNSNEFAEAFEYEIMQEIKGLIENDTFLGKLFSIALNNGSITPSQPYDYYSPVNPTIDYLGGIGVNYEIMTNTITDYIQSYDHLKNKLTLNSSKLSNDSQTEKTRLRNEIVALVKSGKPVLVGGNGYNDVNSNGIRDNDETAFGHLVIAYHYDESEDVLYGNMGWGASYNYLN